MRNNDLVKGLPTIVYPNSLFVTLDKLHICKIYVVLEIRIMKTHNRIIDELLRKLSFVA